ncbi:prevent-host-death family protein [Streptosporangium sp. 'caverna']|nr:prevent-host-death family protein [Streptosporangium sp. 'caverna']
MVTPTVPFSDLSKHSKRVAETLDRVHRVHVKRRDGEDLFISTARHDRQREETADVAARMVAALLASDEGVRAILHALPSVFPWVRHLSLDETQEFVQELVEATRDAVDLDVHATLHRVIVEWRATARILADPALTAQLTRALPDEDHGEVVVL